MMYLMRPLDLLLRATFVSSVSLFFLVQSTVAQSYYSVRSQDQRIEVRVHTADQDGPNADKVGHDYKVTIKDIDRAKKLTINLASGGGWAARIYRKSDDCIQDSAFQTGAPKMKMRLLSYELEALRRTTCC
jgi:hypothetical protein